MLESVTSAQQIEEHLQVQFLQRGIGFWLKLLGGVVGFVWLTWDVSRPVPWLAFFLLTLAAIISEQVIAVEPYDRVPRISGPFLLAAVMLLPPPSLAILIAAVQLATWLRTQWHWRVVALDSSARLLATACASLVYAYFASLSEAPGHGSLALVGSVGAALCLVFAYHLLVPLEGLRILQPYNATQLQALFTRLSVLLLGLPIAIVWQVNSWLTIAALAPLLLTHRALIVPALEREARTDTKTGLHNVKSFNDAMERELQRASRFGHPLSILMIDLDLLRQVNNTQGHQAGDAILRGVADAVRRNIREYDVAARFGGDEFIVLLVECDSDDALGIAERIRRSAEEMPFEMPATRAMVRTTVSIGAASFPQHGTRAEELIYQADLAVYRAKQGGRNRVCLAPPQGPRQDVLNHLVAESLREEIGAGRSRVIPPTAPTEELAPAKRSVRLLLLKLLMAVTITASLAMVVIAVMDLSTLDVPGLVALMLLTVAAEIWILDLYDGSSMSLGVTPVLAATMLFGPAGGVVLGLTEGIVRGFLRHSQPHKVAFNSAVFVLGAALAGTIFRSFNVRLSPDALPLLIGPALIAVFIYYGVNTTLVALAMGLSTGENPASVWHERFRWLLMHYVVLGLLGLFLAAAYSTFGVFALLAFVAPAFSVRYAMHQYISNTTENVAELRRLNAEMQRSNSEMAHINEDLLNTLAAAIDVRDPFVFGHSTKVAEYAVAVAREMNLDNEVVELIRQAALLHDIGKLGIPESILNKPGRLDPGEYAQVKAHSALGAALLGKMRRLQHLIPAIKHHHEWFDGRGYPEGLRGLEIPIEARVLAVCDAIEAMASDRPYHRAMPVPKIVAELQRCANIQFDPAVVQAFVRVATAGSALVCNSAQAVREREARPGDLIAFNGAAKVEEVLPVA